MDEKLDIVLKHKYAEVKVRYLMRHVGNKTAKVQVLNVRMGDINVALIGINSLAITCS